MPGGGGGGVRPRTQARGQRQHQTTSLPLDVLVEIAARSDPATLVRCAATCRDVRSRVADDPAFRGRLRLRHTDRFVLPLLRGHLIGDYDYVKRNTELYLVDTTAPNATRLRKATGGFVSGPDGKPPRWFNPLASRDGLLLIRAPQELRVCHPATGHSQTLPPEPTFPKAAQSHGVNYVLLVGDGEGSGAVAVGRPFQVLMANLELSQHRRYLHIQTFSSEHGTWGCYTQIRTPNVHGNRLQQGLGRALVVGGAVHWLCRTDSGSYVLKFHVRAAQVTVTMLPESFPERSPPGWWRTQHLLVTTSAGGSPIVLVADRDKIWAWVQSKQTLKWSQRPEAVIEAEAFLRFVDSVGGRRPPPAGTVHVEPVWFAERSGVVLIRMHHCGFFWLDLQSMEIVRWFSDPRATNATVYCPIEMDLSSWAPTFSSNL